MAYPLIFEEEKASRFLEAISKGLDIPTPGPNGWKIYDLLTLAGACVAVVMSQDPPNTKSLEVDLSKLPPEQREATGDRIDEDVLGLVNFASNLASMVLDDEFDTLESPVKAMIYTDADGSKQVAILEGDRS